MPLANPRFGLLLAGIILLISGIIFAEKHRAATLSHHRITAPELAYTAPHENGAFAATNENFGANVSLWFNPGQEIHGDNLTYARAIFESELAGAAAYDRLANRTAPGKINLPSINPADKSVNYSLFTIGNFTANLNLTPVLPTPQAIIPTEIKPGLGGSFNF